MKPSLRRSTNLLISLVVLISMLFPGVQPTPASAQAQDDIHREYNAETGKVAFITGEGRKPVTVLGASALGLTPEAQSLALVQRFAPEFGLTDPSQELRLSETDQPRADRVTSKYQQVYQGVPVMAGELIVNASKRGELISINGEVSPGLSLDTNPKFTVETAIEIAKKGMVKWYGGETKDYSGTQALLWIFDEKLLRPSLRPVELVWRIEMVTTQEGTPIRELVLVDAKTGNVSLHFNQVDTAWVSHNSGEINLGQETNSTAISIPIKTTIPSDATITLLPNKTLNSLNISNSIKTIRNNTFSLNIAGFALAATTWYVAATGNDLNSCTDIDSPCLTINGALGKTANGDLVEVATGIYTGSGNEVVLIEKDITLSGGWNASFNNQTGTSTIDGQKTRRGITITVANVIVDNFTIQNGFANPGGGILNDGTLTLNNSLVNGNVSLWWGGGGIYNRGTLTINNSTISGNSAGESCCSGGGGGGGIYNDSGTIILNKSQVNDNTILGLFMGSGIGNYGTFTLNNSTVSGNIGGQAAIYTFGGTMTLNSSTIANNMVTAIYKIHGILTLNNSTVSGNVNTLSFGSGGIDSCPDGGCVDGATIQNSIIFGNTSSKTTAQDCSGMITSSGYNIIGNTTGCLFTSSAGDLINTNPVLGSLIGFPGYMPLLPGSPAVDAGNPSTCLPTDQRGVLRPQGSACDIGAYEYTIPGNVSSLSTVSGSNQLAAPTFAFPRPLKVVALDSQGSPVANANITFTAPSEGASAVFNDTDTMTISAITDLNGIASSSIFTANAQLGTFSITASASGASSADFSLHNIAWYVGATGDDSNSCSLPASPCATINEAINKTVSDGTILVEKGVYTGTGMEVMQINKNISILGGWDSTFTTQNGASIIDGQNVRGGITKDCAIARIDHFNVINGVSFGGIRNCGDLTITNSSIHHNATSDPYDGGGGIASTSGTITLNNVTVSNNTASHYGGGIYISDGILSLNNSTISNNLASYSGGGIYVYSSFFITASASVFLKNSILAGNIANAGTDCYVETSKPIISYGYNLIGDSSGCGFVPTIGDQVGTANNPIRPRFTPLQDNGGSTYTHALMTGSPAINAGNPSIPGSGGDSCLSTDQRGVFRPIEARCDIGAYEGYVSWTPAPLVDTFTAGSTSILPGTFLCNQTDPNCIIGDSHAKAAHTYAIGTYNLYATKHLRDSIGNNGMVIKSTVHYCSPSYPCPYDNAFWSGEQMVYGDAYGFPLADDVVAHELTHGVTQYESNLFYFYQSGAINESFSDVWGEYYDQTNGLGNDTPAVKWLMGENITGTFPSRSMSNPPAYGDPDRMTSPNYDISAVDNGGVHTNSGVNNKAVFLMVDGGVFNGKTVLALGWDKTAAIYYEAQTNLLSSGSDYSDLYYAVQQACANLTGQLGITTADCLQVKNALDAVEMNSQPIVNYNPDAPVCEAGMSIIPLFQDNMEGGAGKWAMTGAWSLQTGYASSSSHMLYGDDFYPSSDSSATMAAGVALPVASNMFLHFKHAFGFEYFANEYYDGGVLEYSINNGSNWVDASPLFAGGQNYTGPIMNYNGTTNALKGRNAFVRDSHGYVSSRYDLTSLGGQTIKFRWRFTTDNSYYYLGWMVDDVQIYNCGAPYPVVSSILHANFNPNNLASVQYTVNFSRGVTGVDISDFSLTTSGVSGAGMSGISGSGSVYTVTVNTGSGDGTIRLNLVDDNSIIDASSRPLGGAGIGDGSFTNGEPYTITKSLAGVTAGVFRPGNGLLYLKNAHISGFADVAINYGTGGDYPIAGDWNGDGTATIGIYRNGSFYLRNSNTLGFADIVFAFGTPGDQPVAGDWDGDGVDTIGVYSNGQFLLRNSNSAGAEDMSFYLGNPGDVGIAGDWNGDGSDTTGVFRPSNGVIFLKNANTSGFADVALNYGLAGDQPVIGDWNDDGIDTIGVYRNAQFLLRNSNTIGFADIVFALGNPGDMPIAGNWDGIP